MVRLEHQGLLVYLENLVCLVLKVEMADPELPALKVNKEIREIKEMLVYQVLLVLMVSTENVDL